MEATVQLILKYVQNPSINLINVDYSDQEIREKEKFKHLAFLPIKHFGSFFPAIFIEKENRFRGIISGILNSILSFWLLLVVLFLKDYSSILLPKKFKTSFNAIRSADLIILKGGSYIYCYGGIKQLVFLYRLLLSSFVAIILNKKIIALGHSVGPVVGWFPKFLVRFCLNRYIRIVVREEISYQFLIEELKIDKNKVELLPDIAFWYKEYKENNIIKGKEFEYILKSEGITINNLNKPKIGLTVRDWHFPMQSENSKKLFDRYLDSIAKVLDKLAYKYGANIFIMPHALSDLSIGEKIIQRTSYARPFLLKGDYSTFILRKLYGAMDIFIGTRIHSAIFALSSGTPVIAIAYEIPKGLGIVKMIEDKYYIIDIASINEEILWERVQSLYTRQREMREAILRKVTYMKEKVENRFIQLIQYGLNYTLNQCENIIRGYNFRA
ncbi:MAG: polysaccharide pyruvyl transferase family protein [bacterium]|nr:polysaccharide pyruvyl transferase family protein [bacterium]